MTEEPVLISEFNSINDLSKMKTETCFLCYWKRVSMKVILSIYYTVLLMFQQRFQNFGITVMIFSWRACLCVLVTCLFSILFNTNQSIANHIFLTIFWLNIYKLFFFNKYWLFLLIYISHILSIHPWALATSIFFVTILDSSKPNQKTESCYLFI